MSRRSVAVATIVALALAGGPGQAWGQAPQQAEGPAPAPAQAPSPSSGYDTVVLRDGGVLRGTIVELRLEREVVIVLAEGTRTIAWQDIALTSLAGAATIASDGQAQAAAQPVPADSAGKVVAVAEDEVAPGPSRPRIVIEATGRPGQVHLMETNVPVGGGLTRINVGASRSVCRAPCGRVIDGHAGNAFFFGGSGLTPSREFFLKDLEGEYVARVRPGRPGLLLGGAAMAMLGTFGSVGGAMIFGFRKLDDNYAIGGTVLGVGLALLAAGVTMAIRGTTRYRLYRRR